MPDTTALPLNARLAHAMGWATFQQGGRLCGIHPDTLTYGAGPRLLPDWEHDPREVGPLLLALAARFEGISPNIASIQGRWECSIWTNTDIEDEKQNLYSALGDTPQAALAEAAAAALERGRDDD